MKVPSEFLTAWYILRYGEDFDGTLSLEDCFRKMVNDEGKSNLWQFHWCWNEMKEMSDQDIKELKEALAFYKLYT